MFLRNTMSKILRCVRGRSQSAAHRLTGRSLSSFGESRSAEEVLTAELEAAQDEFDRAKENPERGADINALTRYILAMERLRKFLAYGEVPPGVMERLNKEQPL